MQREPFFNIAEKLPLNICGVMIIVYLLQILGPGGIQIILYSFFTLIPLQAEGVPVWRQVSGLIGHGFLHGAVAHLLMNCGMLIVFGVVTLRGIRAFSKQRQGAAFANIVFLTVFLIGIVAGALAQWLWWLISDPVSGHLALGASAGVSALFATAGWAIGGRRQMMRYGMAFAVINLLIVLVGPFIDINMAWAAYLGGFLAGMLMAPYCVKPVSTGFSIIR